MRLGNSGLKVSRIILGTMQYGDSKWQGWVLGEEEALKHIKFAYASSPFIYSSRSMLTFSCQDTIRGSRLSTLRM